MPNPPKVVLVALFSLLLTGCVTGPDGCETLNAVSHGTYSGNGYSVNVPALHCDVTVTRKGDFNAVDFLLNPAQPADQKLYSVEVNALSRSVSDEEFQTYWRGFLPEYLTANFGEYGHYNTVFSEEAPAQYGANTFLFAGSGNHNAPSLPVGSIIGLAKKYPTKEVTFYVLLSRPITGSSDSIKASQDFKALMAFAQSFRLRE